MTCCDLKTSPHTVGGFGACAPGALPGGLARTRFFDGMVLTQADLETEQRFWRAKRRLTNRALGTGVVWGLRLRWDARRRQFFLGPGYALDCCGNDLIVECPIEITEADLIALADPALRGDQVTFAAARAASDIRRACVVLQYVECAEDARPVHLDPCAPPTSRCEPSRIRETARLLLVPPPMAPPPDCFDDLFADLDDLRTSITDAVLRDQLFPRAPVVPGPLPSPTAPLPLTLRIAIPGTAPAATTVQPVANGDAFGAVITGQRNVPAGDELSGVVQFELRPSPDWGFFQGAVKDNAGATVDAVAPPLDLHQFWSLEIALPKGMPEFSVPFHYKVEKLGVMQMFGDRATGIADLAITGFVVVKPLLASSGVEVTVNSVRVVSSSSGAAAAPLPPGCLDKLSWAFMAEPADGERHAKALVLAAMYAYFADVTARGASAAQRAIAAKLYIAAWALLGVDASIAGAAAQKLELARILGRLFQCWCDAMVYPGPRCASEHHGVYLGCATIARTGQILSFDMWEHRRHVVTGPLIEHWLGVFGIAGVDVIAARFAQTICCLAGLPPPLPSPDNPQDPNAVPLGRGSLGISFARAARPGREVGAGELVRRVASALLADSSAPLASFRSRLANGAWIELLAPADPGAVAKRDALDPAVAAILARRPDPGRDALRPLVRAAAGAATVELTRSIGPSDLAHLSGPAAGLAKTLDDSGLTLGGLLEAGAEGLLAAHPTADPAAIDELAAAAEDALADLAEALADVATKGPPGRPSELLRDKGVRDGMVGAASKQFGGLKPPVITAAIERAAARSP